MGKNRGRSGRPYRRFRLQVLEAYGNLCHLCRQPIDLSLPPNHPRSFTVDHMDPVSLGGPPVCDLARARPAHHGCNSARGNRPIRTRIHTSTAW